MASVRQLSPDGARDHEVDFSVIVCASTMERWEALWLGPPPRLRAFVLA